MATLNIELLCEALGDNLLGPQMPPKRYLHRSVGTCNDLLNYIKANPGCDREQISHHCGLNPNSAAQYTRALESLGLISIGITEGKNRYYLST